MVKIVAILLLSVLFFGTTAFAADAVDGKEMSMHVTIAFDGSDHPATGNPDADSVAGKAIDARTSDFTLKRGGKVVGSVHRVVSADGKMLTVRNKGTHADGKSYDDTLVFDKQ